MEGWLSRPLAPVGSEGNRIDGHLLGVCRGLASPRAAHRFHGGMGMSPWHPHPDGPLDGQPPGLPGGGENRARVPKRSWVLESPSSGAARRPALAMERRRWLAGGQRGPVEASGWQLWRHWRSGDRVTGQGHRCQGGWEDGAESAGETS